jgi:hypothetical protein
VIDAMAMGPMSRSLGGIHVRHQFSSAKINIALTTHTTHDFQPQRVDVRNV